MTKKLLIPLLLASALSGGCKPAAYLLYTLWPGLHEKDVKAEYAELSGKTVAVVVYVDKRTEFEYPEVRQTVSGAVMGRLAEHVKDVNVVEPYRVVKYQDENIYWDEMDKTELGKAFGADCVLFISLLEFTTREPGSQNLYRGRITAQASLYKVALPERKARVWKGQDIKVRYPETDPTGEPRESDRVIREMTERLFAEDLVKKFYDHKVPIE